ncbi:unnamed protein product [Victoria cruziana]
MDERRDTAADASSAGRPSPGNPPRDIFCQPEVSRPVPFTSTARPVFDPGESGEAVGEFSTDLRPMSENAISTPLMTPEIHGPPEVSYFLPGATSRAVPRALLTTAEVPFPLEPRESSDNMLSDSQTTTEDFPTVSPSLSEPHAPHSGTDGLTEDVPATDLRDTPETVPPAAEVPAGHLPVDPNQPAVVPEQPVKRKRGRKKKLPPQPAPPDPSGGLRVLRRKARSCVYNEKLMDNILQMQIDDMEAKAEIKRRKLADFTKELEIEAMIAHSVGFPSDSLSEEEIEFGVLESTGGIDQANYIVVRNHILTRWRSNVSVWLTEDRIFESIRRAHRSLVSSAYAFLLAHGYINFGVQPPVREAKVRANVLIVGAGLAGLAAAKQLRFLGFKVAVIEGRNRAGGRVFTKKLAGDGVIAAADLGGSVLTGINGNPLGVMARQLGLPLHKVRDQCPLYRPDGKAVNADVDAKVEELFNGLLDKVCKLRQAMGEIASIDVSLGVALETFRRVYRVAEDKEEMMLLNWHLANLEYANAGLLSNLSLAFWDQDDPYEMGGDHCFIPGGNERLVRVLVENLPVFYGRAVQEIRYGSDGVLVVAGGQVFRGDMVLCTVPLGVLKSGSIKFEPELPQMKKDAISRLGFGLLNKVAMLFPRVFWSGGIDTFGHLTEDPKQRGEFFLFYSYASVSGGPLLIALVAGESAIKFEDMPPSDAVRRVLEVLRGIFTPKGIEVPDPIQAVCTRWGKDKFTYGSYSHVAVGSSGDDYDILAESVGCGRVFFAGEATNRRYPATMHGALLSGLREAANISRAASRRGISVQAEQIRGEGVEESVLADLFLTPDMTFGNFSVLFDPTCDNPDAVSLLRVSLGGKTYIVNSDSGNDKGSHVSVSLYSLIPRSQALELNNVQGDDNRLRSLYEKFDAKLVGRRGLGSSVNKFIAAVQSARSKVGLADAPS